MYLILACDGKILPGDNRTVALFLRIQPLRLDTLSLPRSRPLRACGTSSCPRGRLGRRTGAAWEEWLLRRGHRRPPWRRGPWDIGLDVADVAALVLLEEPVADHALGGAHTAVAAQPDGNPPHGLPARHAEILAGGSVVDAFGFDLNGVAFGFDYLNGGVAFGARCPGVAAGDDIDGQTIDVHDDVVILLASGRNPFIGQ